MRKARPGAIKATGLGPTSRPGQSPKLGLGLCWVPRLTSVTCLLGRGGGGDPVTPVRTSLGASVPQRAWRRPRDVSPLCSARSCVWDAATTRAATVRLGVQVHLWKRLEAEVCLAEDARPEAPRQSPSRACSLHGAAAQARESPSSWRLEIRFRTMRSGHGCQ